MIETSKIKPACQKQNKVVIKAVKAHYWFTNASSPSAEQV